MATGNTSAPWRAIAHFGAILLTIGALAGCGNHGDRSLSAAGGSAADPAAADVTPSMQTAHRIRLPLAHHHARHRHAGPR